jgi:GNAT superfamily N-acetyltransferase
MPRQGASAVRGVSEGDRLEIEALIALSARVDGSDLKLSIPSLPADGGPADGAVLFHHRGSLIGYFAFDDAELSGVVHPAHRRRGVGRSLIALGLEVARARGLSTLTLLTEDAVPSGAAFAQALGARRAFSEHRMMLAALPEPSPRAADLTLRAADLGDLETLALVMEDIFAEPAAQVRAALRSELCAPGERFHLAFVAGEPVGCFKAVFAGDRVFLYALGVVPAQRRRGYARRMIADAIPLLPASRLPWRPRGDRPHVEP